MSRLMNDREGLQSARDDTLSLETSHAVDVELVQNVVDQVAASSLNDRRVSQQVQQPALKPVDRGWDAWRVLLAAFVFEALFWGFPTSYGVFQAYYSSLSELEADFDNIPVIGTLAQGVYYLGAPFAAMLTKRLARYQRYLILFGWLLCILGLFTASFADSVSGLIVTQGFIYGLGFVVLTYPILSMLNEWWIVRKGFAFGLISAASGLTGIVMPFILDLLLRKYGYRTTLRACAIAMLVLTTPLIPLLKGRMPISETARQPKMDWTFLGKPFFWVYAVATMVQGFGFFIPPIFLPSFAISIGISSTKAALLLAVMAAAQTAGQFALGWLSDKKWHVSLLTSICCICSAIATASLWGAGKSLLTLTFFSIIYGFFAFGFGTLRVAMSRTITSEQSTMLTMYSVFVFLQGIGNVMVGPITAGLISGEVDLADYGVSRYRETVIFVTISATVAAIVIVASHAVRWCVVVNR